MTFPSFSLRRPWRPVALAALLVLVVVSAGGCRPAPATGSLPDFHLTSLSGGKLGPSDLKGKVVVYDFWATWCTPCHIQAEILHTLYPDVSAQGVEFVAVSVGEQEQVVRDFVRENPFPYPVLVDPDDVVSDQLRIMGLPTLVVVDREGRIVFRTTGVADAETIRQALGKANA